MRFEAPSGESLAPRSTHSRLLLRAARSRRGRVRQILRPVFSRIKRAALFLATSLRESDNGSVMVTVPCGPETFILPTPARSTSNESFAAKG